MAILIDIANYDRTFRFADMVPSNKVISGSKFAKSSFVFKREKYLIIWANWDSDNPDTYAIIAFLSFSLILSSRKLFYESLNHK